jgi:myo-inositol-1(or 4)-monophosphatase
MLRETEVAIRAAKEAGASLLENFQKVKGWKKQTKMSEELVSDADLKAEKIIIEILKKEFPDHGIVSEESGKVVEGEEFWIIDPLDGTHNYLFGFPFFCVVLGFHDKEGPKSSVVYDPMRKDVFFAERGEGAYKNGERMQVSQKEDISESLIDVPTQKFHWSRVNWDFVWKFSELRAVGAGALAMSYLAAGIFDAIVHPESSKDFFFEFPAVLIIKEAGGKATNWKGEEVTERDATLIAANPTLHEKMLETIKEI